MSILTKEQQTIIERIFSALELRWNAVKDPMIKDELIKHALKEAFIAGIEDSKVLKP